MAAGSTMDTSRVVGVAMVVGTVAATIRGPKFQSLKSYFEVSYYFGEKKAHVYADVSTYMLYAK